MLGDPATSSSASKDNDRVLATLSDVTTRVVEELQNGSITGATVFSSEDFTGILSVAVGARCEIFRVLLNGDKAVAVKVFKRQFAIESARNSNRIAKLMQYFLRECGMWKSVDSHPNIVSVLGFIGSFQDYPLPAIVTEFYDSLDLRKYVSETSPPVSSDVRFRLLVDACSGLLYIHSKNICHRDIKASNIFLMSQGEVLTAAIGDFGSAKLENPDMIRTVKSTASTSIAWTPPEYVSEKTVDYSSPTVAGDIWSFGCTVLEVLTGDDPWPPFVNIKGRLLEKQHPPRPDGLDDGVWQMLNFCWYSDPSKRKPASVIKVLLQSQLG